MPCRGEAGMLALEKLSDKARLSLLLRLAQGVMGKGKAPSRADLANTADANRGMPPQRECSTRSLKLVPFCTYAR